MWRGRLIFLLSGLLAILMAVPAGCGGAGKQSRGNAPAAADPLADPGQAGALAALQAYADARKALDFQRAYILLSPSAQAAFDAQAFAALYQGQQSFTFTSAAVEAPGNGVARGYLVSLAILRDRNYKFARYSYTLRYEQGRWGVAQGAGLEPQMLKAFQAKQYDEHRKLADQWLAIDPYAWEAYRERFYNFKETGRPGEARAAWEKAMDLAPPEERPALYATLAMLYALNREGDPLLETAKKALESAKELGEAQQERYDLRWRAGVLINMAYACRFKGDSEQARRYFEEAQLVDPRSPDVERYAKSASDG